MFTRPRFISSFRKTLNLNPVSPQVVNRDKPCKDREDYHAPFGHGRDRDSSRCSFNLTITVTTVATGEVPVITLFTRINNPIATGRGLETSSLDEDRGIEIKVKRVSDRQFDVMGVPGGNSCLCCQDRCKSIVLRAKGGRRAKVTGIIVVIEGRIDTIVYVINGNRG